MADRKISDLTALTTPASGDFLPIVDISEAAAASKNKRITIEELMRGVPDGTAAAPGIAFETDPNTGIYRPGADQLAVSTGGTERARIDSGGRLLVGTSTFRTFGSTGYIPQFLIEGLGGSASTVGVVRNSANAAGCSISLAKSRGTSAGGVTAVNVNDELALIDFQGADGTGLVPAARIQAFIDGTPDANDMPGRLVFSTTADGAALPTERLRITSTGQVRLAGAGITFNGDTAAANELDDYEEGTWTPVVEGTSTAGTGTYIIQSGNYTKIGNRVLLSARVRWSAHTGTGSIFISGLPFTVSALSSFSMRTADGLTVSAHANYVDQAASKLVIEASIIGTGDVIFGAQYKA